jgi:hypothetical protein
MDVCCFNRPFDDLSQDRIYLEAEAILAIISHCEHGKWSLMSSSVLDFELSKSWDGSRLEKVRTLYATAREWLQTTSQVEQRATFFQQCGIKIFDSLHLALAEVQKVDVFLTTDDRLLRAANKMDLDIKVSNPIAWLMEVMRDER